MGKQVLTTSGESRFVCDTPDVRPVAASVTAVELMPMNPDRVHGQIFNDSTSVLYVRWGAGATSTVYTTKVAPQGFYELPRVNAYVGPVSGVWATANGSAKITEAS